MRVVGTKRRDRRYQARHHQHRHDRSGNPTHDLKIAA
jgi:hypothetical protein